MHKQGCETAELATAEHVQQVFLPDGPNDLAAVLGELAERGCNEVLVEAGPAVLGSFIRSGLWDEWIAYVAPKVLGADSQSVTDIALDHLLEAPQARLVETSQIGDDLRLTLRPLDH
jgi:diaminohydroxyphosphoribosylaminopyrimidine deaminase/5-amino-6-(5-phosphoribosylamino)uracil reductase